MEESKQVKEPEDKLIVDYAENAKEDRLSNVFRFDYIDEHLKIEFAQIKGYNQENHEYQLTVTSSIIIPKKFIESFLMGLLKQVNELLGENEISLENVAITAKETQEDE